MAARPGEIACKSACKRLTRRTLDHQLLASPAQALELVVDRRCRGHCLQGVARDGDVGGELKQFENAPRVDGIGLGGRGEYLFVARQFEVVDAVELPATVLYLAIKLSRPAVVAFHGDTHR